MRIGIMTGVLGLGLLAGLGWGFSDAPQTTGRETNYAANASPGAWFAYNQVNPDAVAGIRDPMAGPENEKATAKTLEKLRRPVVLTAKDRPLHEVIKNFSDLSGVDIFVKWKTLESAGIDRNSHVSFSIQNPTPWYRMFEMVLGEVGGGTADLRWTIDSGMVIVTTAEDLNSPSYALVAVYDVRDLVHLIVAASHGRENSDDIVRDIRDTIESVVATDSWRDKGGFANLSELNGQLIVTQTARNQWAVRKLLDELQSRMGIGKVKYTAGGVSHESLRSRTERGVIGVPLSKSNTNTIAGRTYEAGKN